MYAGVSGLAHAADVAAGTGLLVAGLVAWFDSGSRRLGALAMLAAAAWFAPDWEGWDHGSPVVRSIGTAAGPLFLVLVFHLVLSSPSGRIRGLLSRAALAAAYASAFAVVLGRALFRDPFLDPYCWRNCLDNVFLVHPDQGIAQALDDVWLRSAVALGVVLIISGVWRLLAGTASARRALFPVLVPGVFVGGAEAAYAVAHLRSPLEQPRSSEFLSIFFARSLAVGGLALGLLWVVARARRTRTAVARLAAELGNAPPPGKLEQALAVAVGDPTLEVAYWLPASRRYVGTDGRPVETPASRDGRVVTPIVRDGQPVALVAHDPALLDGPALEKELGSAARLAVENERLQAEVHAQLEDLRTSRARIVDRGDAERRRLERNLHDGAQQRLLALSYDLRLAHAGVEAADADPELTALLISAVDAAQIALGELRELANGIYPAILAEAGLAAALATLADEAPLPVELGKVTEERYAAPVETAAYLTVVESVADAVKRAATYVSVSVRPEQGSLIVTLSDDGSDRSSALVHLTDRIGALGGSVDVGPKELQAEIRCE
jgi:signal transduction histidine kinase